MELDLIQTLIKKGDIEDAIFRLDTYIEKHPDEDKAWYLRGNAYRKIENFQFAINNYLRAIELNPDSPAVAAHKMVINILNFYNKDMFNH